MIYLIFAALLALVFAEEGRFLLIDEISFSNLDLLQTKLSTVSEEILKSVFKEVIAGPLAQGYL